MKNEELVFFMGPILMKIVQQSHSAEEVLENPKRRLSNSFSQADWPDYEYVVRGCWRDWLDSQKSS